MKRSFLELSEKYCLGGFNGLSTDLGTWFKSLHYPARRMLSQGLITYGARWSLRKTAGDCPSIDV